jgi:hypothetical protein
MSRPVGAAGLMREATSTNEVGVFIETGRRWVDAKLIAGAETKKPHWFREKKGGTGTVFKSRRGTRNSDFLRRLAAEDEQRNAQHEEDGQRADDENLRSMPGG